MVFMIPVQGYFSENCYIYADDKTKHGFLIDPGAEHEKILDCIEKNGITIEKILLTHGHFDHFGAVHALCKALSVPVFAYSDEYLCDPKLNLSRFCTNDMVIDYAEWFDDGDIITLSETGEISLKVIYTPGHTEDSVIFYDEKVHIAFVGDTIFKGSIGTDQYPGGNKMQLYNSIENIIFLLPDETVLFSGHSEKTTIGIEKKRYS